jgi:hypothetical protein
VADAWGARIALTQLREWLADLRKRKHQEKQAIQLKSPLLPLAA